MKFRVLVTDSVDSAGLESLVDSEAIDVLTINDSATDEFAEALAGADALVVRSATKVSREVLEAAPLLKAVARAGVGVDNIDIPAASERGVAVFNAAAGNTIAAAELTMGLLISVARRIPEADASLRAGRWQRSAFSGVELRGKTLGLIGAGRIGGEVAVRCKAFDMRVIGYDPYLSPTRAEELGIEMVGLKKVLKNADFISIHVPLTEETVGIIGMEALQRMKPTVFLVNASRGGVVDEGAVALALQEGVIAGAALDVYESEPLPEESPLRSAPNLVLTPHLGASTVEAQEGVAREVALKVRLLLETGNRADAVNALDLD